MAGTKHDQGKPDHTLIPREAEDAMARAFMYGAAKYGRGNYKAGIEYLRLAASCRRHLSAWIAGEDIDAESGNNHIDHALASLAMLAYHIQHSPEMDNRDHKVMARQKALTELVRMTEDLGLYEHQQEKPNDETP